MPSATPMAYTELPSSAAPAEWKSATLAAPAARPRDSSAGTGIGDAIEGLREIWLGIVIVMIFLAAINYKRVGVAIGIIVLIIVLSAFVYGGEAFLQIISGLAEALFTAVADALTS